MPAESETNSEGGYSSADESGSHSDDSIIKKPVAGFPFDLESQFIPHRMQQVLIGWIFIAASVALLMDFGSLQVLLEDLANPNYFAELCNWFGVVSCVLWLLGFIILAHWLHCVGATQMGLIGCYLKLIASVLFNLQPMTGTMNDRTLGGGAGLWWSNLVGILFFHVGNLVSCTDMFLHTPPGADKKKGWLYHGNLPVTGMWVYQAATWFLVAANVMACASPGSTSLVPITDPRVYCCQFSGAGLLLLGSVIYTTWCAGFHNFSYAA